MNHSCIVVSEKYFTAVTCFLFFNLFDWLGRTFAGPVHWVRYAFLNMMLFFFNYCLCMSCSGLVLHRVITHETALVLLVFEIINPETFLLSRHKTLRAL